MSTSKVVVLMPPQLTQTGRFQLREDPGRGYARADGTFTKAWEPWDGVTFDTAAEAIQWAKSPPRNWSVLNESMF
jgi:hypothetical protein